MNTQTRYAVYSLAAVVVLLTLLLAIPEASRSTARARAAAPTANLVAWEPNGEEGSATLTPSSLNTSTHINLWHSKAPYCSPDFVAGFSPEEISGSVVAGYRHTYDKGKPVLGCPSGNNSTHRGSVWFDLSEIAGKAPPLHVSVQTATLTFRRLSGDCPGELMVGTKNWMKGFTAGALVPGDTLAPLECSGGGCRVDVKIAVDNWLKGSAHGGYDNDGFVIKGMTEEDLEYADNDSCLARYGDFTLTVNYKYDKTPLIVTIPLPKPKRPEAPIDPGHAGPAGGGSGLARTNYALGGVASASSTLDPWKAAYVNDGDVTTASDRGVWLDGTRGSFPDWIQIDFKGMKTIDQIVVVTRQDDLTSTAVPALTLPCKLYGISNFEVQYLEGGKWVTVKNGNVTGNGSVWRKFNFPKVTTGMIRLLISGSQDNQYSRVVELEAWGA
jgi:hypothetical protein